MKIATVKLNNYTFMLDQFTFAGVFLYILYVLMYNSLQGHTYDNEDTTKK